MSEDDTCFESCCLGYFILDLIVLIIVSLIPDMREAIIPFLYVFDDALAIYIFLSGTASFLILLINIFFIKYIFKKMVFRPYLILYIFIILACFFLASFYFEMLIYWRYRLIFAPEFIMALILAPYFSSMNFLIDYVIALGLYYAIKKNIKYKWQEPVENWSYKVQILVFCLSLCIQIFPTCLLIIAFLNGEVAVCFILVLLVFSNTILYFLVIVIPNYIPFVTRIIN